MTFDRNKYPRVVHLHLQMAITTSVYRGNLHSARRDLKLLHPIERASFEADLKYLLHLLAEEDNPQERTTQDDQPRHEPLQTQ